MKYLKELRDQIEKSFNRSELNDICFDLGVNHENIPGEILRDRARELVRYCASNDKVDILLEICQQHRPKISWKDLVGEEEREQLKNLATVNIRRSTGDIFKWYILIDMENVGWVANQTVFKTKLEPGLHTFSIYYHELLESRGSPWNDDYMPAEIASGQSPLIQRKLEAHKEYNIVCGERGHWLYNTFFRGWSFKLNPLNWNKDYVRDLFIEFED